MPPLLLTLSDTSVNCVTFLIKYSILMPSLIKHTYMSAELLDFVFQEVLNKSDHQAVLQLINLVSGRYIFTLEVQDAEGLSSTDTASVIIKPGMLHVCRRFPHFDTLSYSSPPPKFWRILRKA